VGVYPAVRILMLGWLAVIALFGGAFSVLTLVAMWTDPEPISSSRWLGVATPLGMLVFGLGLIRLCSYLARDEPGFLTRFLIETLDARQPA
jgi:uncharacterized membrane protein YgdD (TMEM256/DUF423 family)